METLLTSAKYFQEPKTSWTKILEIILAIGNFLNGKNRERGNIYGFTIESLSKIGETKAGDNKTTLLEYIVTLIYKKFPDVMEDIPNILSKADAGARIGYDTFGTTVDEIEKKIVQLNNEIKHAKENQKFSDDMFVPVMEVFPFKKY